MDARLYLKSYGWKDGQALKHGGIKKPILVKHKKDKKGLGSDGKDTDVWWERLFDGQLKSLDVSNGTSGVVFETNSELAALHLRRSTSPLYKMFVKGEGLAGTVGSTENAHVKTKLDNKAALEATEKMLLQSKDVKECKEEKSKKKGKSDKKDRKEKKEKNSRKERKEKKKKTKDGLEKEGKLKNSKDETRLESSELKIKDEKKSRSKEKKKSDKLNSKKRLSDDNKDSGKVLKSKKL